MVTVPIYSHLFPVPIYSPHLFPNFFVPVPGVDSMEELNCYLGRRCLEDLQRRVRGKSGTKQELLREDQAAFLPLPAAPFDACRKASTAADRLSLVRFDANDYSVPVCYAHHPVVVKGYPDKVLICRQDAVIASFARRFSLKFLSNSWVVHVWFFRYFFQKPIIRFWEKYPVWSLFGILPRIQVRNINNRAIVWSIQNLRERKQCSSESRSSIRDELHTPHPDPRFHNPL